MHQGKGRGKAAFFFACRLRQAAPQRARVALVFLRRRCSARRVDRKRVAHQVRALRAPACRGRPPASRRHPALPVRRHAAGASRADGHGLPRARRPCLQSDACRAAITVPCRDCPLPVLPKSGGRCASDAGGSRDKPAVHGRCRWRCRWLSMATRSAVSSQQSRSLARALRIGAGASGFCSYGFDACHAAPPAVVRQPSGSASCSCTKATAGGGCDRHATLPGDA